MITPTPLTAALAGVFASLVMPALWSRFGTDSGVLVIAFLAVVAFPAHAFVVGFGRKEAAHVRSVDTALLKRVGAWLVAACVTAAAQALLG